MAKHIPFNHAAESEYTVCVCVCSCKHSHGDTRREPPRPVKELPPSVRLQLRVGHSLPGALDRVNGVNEAQVVPKWHLKQPAGRGT